jgi:DNA-binding NtrC family response regulator
LSLGSRQNPATRLIGAQPLPELAVQSFRLELVRGPDPGQSWELGPRTRLGKGPDNDIVVADATVSRHHLEIEQTPAGFLLRDLGSTNGTFLDNARIVEAYLRPAMELRVGEVALRLRAQHEGVRIEPTGQDSFGELRGRTAAMRRIFALLERVAPTDATILITGETGTGKGAVARAIHAAGLRADKPFVTVDCGAISRTLIESELFGHEKGSFTGATHQRRGALETCAGGTLFIDELDDLPLEVQPKLLRALDAREITRVGSNKPLKLDLRVVAATKKDLRQSVDQGQFREDLYYRLSVVTFALPPLRERLDDVPLLAERFLTAAGTSWDRLQPAFQARLLAHTFPGNVRELRNLLERASYLDELEAFDPTCFPSDSTPANADSELRFAIDYRRPFKLAKEGLVHRFEREYLSRLLARTSRNITRAAREADIDRKYLYMLLSKHAMMPGAEETGGNEP